MEQACLYLTEKRYPDDMTEKEGSSAAVEKGPSGRYTMHCTVTSYLPDTPWQLTLDNYNYVPFCISPEHIDLTIQPSSATTPTVYWLEDLSLDLADEKCLSRGKWLTDKAKSISSC